MLAQTAQKQDEWLEMKVMIDGNNLQMARMLVGRDISEIYYKGCNIILLYYVFKDRVPADFRK